jgi:hypothetical protein
MSKFQAGGLIQSRTPLLGSQLNPNQILESYGVPITNEWDLYKDKELLNIQRTQSNMSQLDYINRVQQQKIENQIKLQTQERLNKNYDLQNKKLEFQTLKEANDQLTSLMEMDKDFVPPAMLDYYQGIKKQVGVDDETIANLSPYDLEEITRVGSKKRAIMYSQKNIQNFKYNLKTLDDNLKNAKGFLDKAEELAKLGILDADEHMKFMDAYNQVQRDRLIYTQTPVNLATGVSEIDPFNSEAAKYLSTLPDLIDGTAYKALAELDKEEQKTKIIEMNAKAEQAKANALNYTFDAEQNKIRNEQAQNAVSLWKQWIADNPSATLDEKASKHLQYVGPYINAKGSASGGNMSLDELLTQSLQNGNDELVNKIMNIYKTKNTYSSSRNSTVDYKIDSQSGHTYTIDKEGNQDYGGYIVDKSNKVKQITIQGQSYTVDGDFMTNEVKDSGVEIITSRSKGGVPSAYIKVPANKDNKKILNWLKSKFGGSGDNLQDYILNNKSIKIGDFIYIVSDNIKKEAPIDDNNINSSSSGGSWVPAPSNMSSSGIPEYLKK